MVTSECLRNVCLCLCLRNVCLCVCAYVYMMKNTTYDYKKQDDVNKKIQKFHVMLCFLVLCAQATLLLFC